MLKDDSPPKPPEKDSSEQTIDTHAPGVSPGISLLGAAADQSLKPNTAATTFSSGDIVAKRFRIVNFIAQGGMGEVYEALDIELKQKVALKTVRSVLLSDVQALERFRQEIVVAKRVAHPNVCRTHDLFRHESGKAGEPDVLLVSMELLRGETLNHVLRVKGKLAPAEALPLIKQMIAGLAAAHHAGVVHRDFKTSNVMLVPQASASGAVRVVVADFGLAHSLDAGEFALTRTGEMLGTPAYMAPEQVTGKEITPATDIYSLGVVMFEMLTGQLPFTGKNWRELAFKRIEGPAPSPKSLRPEVDDRWSRTILKCLEREPSDRFQTVEEAERALAGETETKLRDEIAAQRRRKRLVLAAAGLLTVAAIGVVIGIAFPNLFPWRRSPTVTVLGFKNLSGDQTYDPWGNQFRASLGMRLGVKPVVYKTPASMGNAWSPPPPSQMFEEPSEELVQKLRRFGCRYAVYGDYDVSGAPGARKIGWDINVLDVEAGSRESIHRELMETDRQEAASAAAADIRKILGVPPVPEIAPRNSNAVEDAYSNGVLKMDNFDFEGARQEFEKALEGSPDYARARSALAQAYWNLGYEEKAQEQAALAAKQAQDLPPDEQIIIKLRNREYSKQWDAAADTYRLLWDDQPSSAFYGLEMSRDQMEGNHPAEALATLEKVKNKYSVVGVLAQADLLIADVQERLGKNQERLAAAQLAAKEASEAGSQYLLANARIQQCGAMKDLGMVKEVDAVCEDAVQQSQKLGFPSLIAHAKTALANLFYLREQYDKARQLYQQASEATHAIGDLRNEAGALLNLGAVEYKLNNLSEARKWFERSLEVSRKRGGVNDDLMDAQDAIADVDGAMGNTKAQISGLLRVVEEAQSVGDKERLANVLGNLCSTQVSTGEVVAAKPYCERALQLRREIRAQSELARSLTDMGDYLLSSDKLGPASESYREAFSIQTTIGEAGHARDTRRNLAVLEMEKGNISPAEADLKALLPEYAVKDTDGEATTRAILADLYLRMNRLDDAQEQITKGLELAGKSQDPSIAASLNIQNARLEIKRKQTATAAVSLNKLEASLRSSGLLELAIEARLARADTLSSSFRRTELKAIAEEARQHGYLLLMRKAQSAAGA